MTRETIDAFVSTELWLALIGGGLLAVGLVALFALWFWGVMAEWREHRKQGF